jgi:hypothetical protein
MLNGSHHHGIANPPVVNVLESVNNVGMPVNILNKLLQTDDKECFSSMGVKQELTTPCLKNTALKFYTVSQT